MSNKSTKVLIVDDSAMIRKIAKTNLMKFEISKCDEAGDGKTAWQMLATGKYDVLLTDYNMPDMNGLELVAKIFKEGERFKDLKIAVISSAFTRELMMQFKKLGVETFLTKPFNFDMFKDVIMPLIDPNFEQESAKLTIDDIAKLFSDTAPVASFNENGLVLDFGSTKITIDPEAIIQNSTVHIAQPSN